MRSSLDRSRRITTLLALASAVGLGACATGGARGARGGEVIRLSDRGRISETLDSIHVVEVEQRLAEQGREGGPRVSLRTNDVGSLDRVTASFNLDDDAYVAVFNVDTDGRVRTLFPESPEDMGYLKGGYTYRLSPFFPGFGSRTYSSAFRPSYGGFGSWSSFYASSAYGLGRPAGAYGRQGGYVFIVASWSPLRLDQLEEEDLWDSYLVADRIGDLMPYRVMHAYAERIVPRGRKWYTVDYRYYGESRAAGGMYASQQCADMDYLGQLGYLRYALLSGRVSPTQLAAMYNMLSLGGCHDNVTMMYRALIAAMLNQQRGFAQPGGIIVPPAPPTPGTGGDTLRGGVSQPAPTDHPKRGGTRRADGDDGPAAPLNRPPRRGDAEAGDENVIDLGAARPTRAQRDRIPRDWARERAGNGAGAWSGGSRVYRGRGAGEADRTTRTAEPRGAAPRTERARPEPRTERPRPEPRTESPRYDPPPRASEPAPAPAPAPAPRGETGSGGGKPREP